MAKENDDVDRFNEADKREVDANELRCDTERTARLLARTEEAVEWNDPPPISHRKRRLIW